ncbi:MAG: phosphate/phosphite/phosphonate ABC transporter substrate-binding protein [Hyphomicrobiaceae bacterium]|nr:phosphate/phosphite/phosphonate ABC transporter substrate-binding protein [Hyphomicrobiaceae bacterium]
MLRVHVVRSLSMLARAIAVLMVASTCLASAALAQDKLRFAVGPFQPTPSDTKRAYEPFFKHLADKLGRDYELVVTTDWAGIAVALANKQADIAWMGPWGYVLANNEGGAQAIATVKYNGKPTYHSIIVARPDAKIEKWPDDAKGLRMSFADAGSTSGWLIPTHWFKMQGIDPKVFFQYRDGASHAAQVLSVVEGQTDLATDFDRNLNSLIDRGAIKPEQVKIVWRSEPLPNDPLVVREGLDPDLVQKVQEIVLAITEDEAKTLMPKNYTGWVPATHANYKLIEDAGLAVGRLKPRTATK